MFINNYCCSSSFSITILLHLSSQRCVTYILCYKAGLCERTVALVQHGHFVSRETWADARENAALRAQLHAQAVAIRERLGASDMELQ